MPALETMFIPAGGDRAMAYRLSLANTSGEALAGFRLCFSGPGQIAPTAKAEGGTIGRIFSTFVELVPPPGTGFDGTVYVGVLSASPPAVQPISSQ